MKFTLTGYFSKQPHMHFCHLADADSIGEAIAKTEAMAREESQEVQDTYLNTFVFEGDCKLLSSWAG